MISANNVTLRVGKKALFEDVNIKFTERKTLARSDHNLTVCRFELTG